MKEWQTTDPKTIRSTERII